MKPGVIIRVILSRLRHFKKSKMKNIVLVGFMGTGKTTVAKLLSKQLKMRYVSTDALREENEKMPITDIFASDGEKYFRQVEEEVVRGISSEENMVIDAGGGVVIKEENLKILKKKGTIICLIARPEIILDRTTGYKHRPLLNVVDPKKKIQELLLLRMPYYKKANFTVDTSDLSIDEVVKKIKDIVLK